ncbi:ABC transporter ATP-binding protein [Anaerorhabdus sp.]|uniref:ABC transporter ATP-binding protein n=1 Tax=Anaerorhabdus sp. TaxID=1872524 RepID=UPI002B20BD1F|nr:ABC transporter ATP-binding protein [Anaerorhabdus sp.]MEA4874816.1 ABC transporter ATP-binding protein [Anaerorhabdus sp.]
MNTIKKYCKPFYKALLFGLLVKTIGSVVELFIPYILSTILDNVVPQKDIMLVIIWGTVMIMCSLLAWGMNVYANRKASKVARDVTENIRHDLFDKTIHLSCTKTDEYTIPSLESRLTTDTYNVHRMLGMVQRMGVRAPILTIGGIVMTFILEPTLALVLLAVIPFIAVIIYIRSTKGIPLFAKVQVATDKMIQVVRENIQGIRVIKALSKMDAEKKRYFSVNNNLRNQERSANIKMAIINPSMNLFLNIGLSLVILVGAYQVNAGLSETGKIIAFMSYFTIISNALLAISNIFVILSKGFASANRIDLVLEETENNPKEKLSYPKGDPNYAIEFRNVSFSYLKIKDNIRNISFKLKPGETLGILGATGSGKTTIMQLLLRFYEIDEGAIYLNGIDIREIEPKELRQMFGIVMQNDFLFSDSIKENIVFGREIESDDLDAAIIDAQASDFIRSLEQNVDYHLTSKGTNVSGGQRQRILLSRAFASHPEFMLLDDSSSALDYGTDAKLRKAINENYQNTTMIIIAQRISSIKSANQILVLDNGQISDLGSHAELLERSEIYASISDSQMGGALVD